MYKEDKEDIMFRDTLAWAIKGLNNRVNIADLKKKYFNNEDRILVMNIAGTHSTAAFMVDTTSNEIVLIDSNQIPNPTATAFLSQETFWKIISGKLNPRICFYDSRLHPIAIEGDAPYRDMANFANMWTELLHVIADILK